MILRPRIDTDVILIGWAMLDDQKCEVFYARNHRDFCRLVAPIDELRPISAWLMLGGYKLASQRGKTGFRRDLDVSQCETLSRLES